MNYDRGFGGEATKRNKLNGFLGFMDDLSDDCIGIILSFCERKSNAAFLAMTCHRIYQLAQLCKIDIRFRWVYCLKHTKISLDLFSYMNPKKTHRLINAWINTANTECLAKLPGDQIWNNALKLPPYSLDEFPHLFDEFRKILPSAIFTKMPQFINWYLLRYYQKYGYDETSALMDENHIIPNNHKFSPELINIFIKKWNYVPAAMYGQYTGPDKHTIINCPQLPYYYMPLNEITHDINTQIFVDLKRWDAIIRLLNLTPVPYYCIWCVIEIEDPEFYALSFSISKKCATDILKASHALNRYKHFAFWRAMLPKDIYIKFDEPKNITAEIPYEICIQIDGLRISQLKDIILFDRCDLFEYFMHEIQENFDMNDVWQMIADNVNYGIMKMFFELFYTPKAHIRFDKHINLILTHQELMFLIKCPYLQNHKVQERLLLSAITYLYYDIIEILVERVDIDLLGLICLADNWIMYKIVRHKFTDKERVNAIHGMNATYIASHEVELINRLLFV